MVETVEKLYEMRDTFELVLENVNDLICIVNPKENYKIEMLNQRLFQDILGFSRNELIGRSFLELIFQGDGITPLPMIENALYNKDQLDEIKIKKKDGNYIWVKIKGKQANTINAQERLLIILKDITDIKIKEKEFRDAELKFELISNYSDDFYAILNDKFEYEYINERVYKERLGFDKDEIVGKPSLNLIYPEDVKKAVRGLRKGFDKGENSADLRIRTIDGGYVWVETKGRIFIDRYGNKKAFLTGRDITARKEAEQKLNDSREKYRFITENISDIISLFDENFKLKYVNEAQERISGFTEEEIIGKSPLDFLHPEDIQEAARIFKKTLQDGEGGGEFKMRSIDNTYKWMSVNGRVTTDQKGNRIILLVSRDISKEKFTEQKLKESEEKYKVLFENSPNAILLIDTNGIILDCNSTSRKLSEFIKSDLIGNSFIKVAGITEEFLPIILNKMKLLLKGEDIELQDIQLYTKSGSKKWVSIQGALFKFGEEEVIQVIIQDISEKKEVELEIEASRKKLDIYIDSMIDGFCINDLIGTIVQINKSFVKMFGYKSPKQIIGKKIFDFVSKEEVPRMTKRFLKTIKNKELEIKNFEIECFRKDNSEFTGSFNIRNLWEDDKYSGSISIARDITEKNLAEQRLKESEENYRILFNKSPVGITISNSDNEIILMNNRIEKITGYTKEELNKINIESIYIDDKQHEEIFEIMGARGFIRDYEIKIKQKEGTERTCLLNVDRYDISGASVFQTTLQDITKSKEAEKKLIESEEKFRMIAEQSMMGICIVQDNRVKYLNKVFPEIWGYSMEEMIDWTVEDIQKVIYPEDREFIIGQLKKKQEGQPDIELNYKYRGIKKSGDTIWIENFSKTIIYQEKPADLVTIIDITERKNAEQQLKESEETYRTREKNLLDIVIELNFNGRISYISHQVFDILGYKEEELIGTNAFTLAHPDDVSQIKQITEESYKQNRPIFFEFRAKHKDGYYIPMSSRGNVIIVDNIPKIVGTVKDDSEKKEAETRLKQSEEKYRNLFDTSPNAIILMDKKGKIQDCNLTTEIMLGYKKEELIGENYLDLQAFSPTVKPIERIKVMDTKKEIHNPVEIQVKRKDGSQAWITAQTSNIKIGDKKLFQIIIQDITEKRTYEELISELNMNFLTFTADIQSNIHLLLNTCCGLLNGTLALFVSRIKRNEIEQYEVITSDRRMFTYDAREFEQMNHLSEFFKEEHDYSQVLQNVHDTNYAETDHFIQDHSIKGSYGKLIKLQDDFDGLLCILYQENPIIGHQDDLVMFLICDAIEIEQRRWKAKEQLEAQNEALNEISKLKSDLLSRTSHELKTPLISIKGFTELLITKHGYKLDSDMISILDEIKDGSVRLERIIHSLLQSSKLEQEKVVLNTSQEDLSFLIKFCVKEVESLALLREQTISIDIPVNIIISIDKERLYDVVINLLSNAIKNTPPKGEILVFTNIKDDSVVVSVKDNGVGITEEEREKLFKKFGKIERYGKSWDINIEGTGLGLYIAKKIVKLHGGTIWVESEGRNKGSTFNFSIPRK